MKYQKLMLFLLFAFPIVVAPQSVTAQATVQEEEKKTEDKKVEKSPEQIAKEADIRELLKVSGAGDMGVQVIDQMIGAFRQQNPKVPSEYWEEFRAEVDADELIEITIPTYNKHFTHDEIKELIKFYQSTIGKKLVEKQPLMMQEGMIAGQKWGMKLGRRLQEKLQSDF